MILWKCNKDNGLVWDRRLDWRSEKTYRISTGFERKQEMKSIVTEYDNICIFCGRQAEAEHHLIFGTAGRELSDKDGLKVPICNNCHNMGDKLHRIHDNPMAERLSKMLGQAMFEAKIGSREEFRKRYGRSYL